MKELGPSSDLQTFEIRAGNQLLDMFRPCYWSLAFCFLFKHATAEPDVTNTTSSRQEQEVQKSRRRKGNKTAPEVGIQEWAAAMQRQVAPQFRRDWNFSPALWNYLFRTMINLQPNASKFTVANAEGRGRRDLTNDELKMAAQEIYNSMQYGMYVDINGENKAVNGDLTKLRHVPGPSAEGVCLGAWTQCMDHWNVKRAAPFIYTASSSCSASTSSPLFVNWCAWARSRCWSCCGNTRTIPRM